jgi:hypothetical protein
LRERFAMENRPYGPPQTARNANPDPDVKSGKRDLTQAERWFRSFNSAYRVRVGDHYETVVERSLPFTGR